MNISYAAVERFGPHNAKSWANYVAWSGLYHLKELVSLDGSLCPNLLTDYTEEDWQHIADEEFVGNFRDLNYLLSRLTTASDYQVLAVIKNPLGFETLDDSRFEYIGYDLIEQHGTISALTNCGGFDNAFQPDDLSVYGLISDYEKAVCINRLLQQNNPDEPHAICTLWKIWRMTHIGV